MRKAITTALLVYVLISQGGATLGPFDSRVDCEAARPQQTVFAYCVALWE